MATVLIGDDDSSIRDMYAIRLVGAGFVVHQAMDGQDVLDQADKVHPDIILLDVMMPKMNGLDALKLLKSSDKTKDIPVVIMTALASDVSQMNDISHQANDYISKSDVLPDQMVERVKAILKIT